jgi:hypothetical protein
MSGKAIGIAMNLGYPGTVSRNGLAEIFNRLVKSIVTNGSETLSSIEFGAPVVLNADNSYSRWGDTGTGVSTATAANFGGIAVRNVKQAITYDTGASAFKPGEHADVINMGPVVVKVGTGTPTAGGAVYIRTVASGTKKVGDFECAAVADENVEITNLDWTTGNVDSNGMAEVTIKTKATA